MANYSFKPLPPIPDNRIFERINFCRMLPHTPIYEGETGLTFRDCNLTNCDVPADAVVESCLRTHISFCSILHPQFSERWGLPECGPNCAHKTTDQVSIDGVLIETIPYYEDMAV